MKNKTYKNSVSQGFTLIELLVVIAIIGLIVSVVLAALTTARLKGQDAARMEDVKSVETAMELFYVDNSGYPTSNDSSNGDVVMSDSVLSGKLLPKYLPSMPALLVADGDHYYGNGVTTGVTTGYDMLIYLGTTNSWCRAGVLPQNTGDWGVATTCKF